MEKSQFLVPGAKTSGSVREVLPNVNAGGAEKTAVLKYCVRRLSVGPRNLALVPLLLGRDPPPSEWVLLTEVVRPSGCPFWKVVTPLSCHPPTIMPTTLPPPFRSFFPGPKGSSQL